MRTRATTRAQLGVTRPLRGVCCLLITVPSPLTSGGRSPQETGAGGERRVASEREVILQKTPGSIQASPTGSKISLQHEMPSP